MATYSGISRQNFIATSKRDDVQKQTGIFSL